MILILLDDTEAVTRFAIGGPNGPAANEGSVRICDAPVHVHGSGADILIAKLNDIHLGRGVLFVRFRVDFHPNLHHSRAPQ